MYALQSVAVFEYLGVFQRNVDRLVDGESRSSAQLVASTCISKSGTAHPSSRPIPTPRLSAEPQKLQVSSDQLADPEERLFQLALQHDQPELAARLLTLYGRATCPSCRKSFEVPAALT